MVFCPYQLGLKCYAPVIFCFWPGVLGVFLYFGVLGYIWAIFVEFGPTNTGTFILGTGATWCESATRRCCFLFSHYFWAFLVFWVDNGIFSLCMNFEGQWLMKIQINTGANTFALCQPLLNTGVLCKYRSFCDWYRCLGSFMICLRRGTYLELLCEIWGFLELVCDLRNPLNVVSLMDVWMTMGNYLTRYHIVG